jgi:hypothetical protein
MKGKLIGIESTILGSLSYVRPDVREAVKKYEAQISYENIFIHVGMSL